MIDDLMLIRSSTSVKRFHTVDLLVPETVGHHVANVSMIIIWLFYPQVPSGQLLSASVLHDVPEVKTGDTPAPAKWRNPSLEEALRISEQDVWSGIEWMPYDYVLDTEEKAILKFADMADLTMKCLYERQLGNDTLDGVASRGWNYLVGKIEEIPAELRHKADQLMYYIGDRV